MSKYQALTASCMTTLLLIALPNVMLSDTMPTHDTVCNYIAEYDAEDDLFRVNGYPFHDGNFDYPDPNNHLHWYVETFNLTNKESFFCSCLTMPDNNICTPSS